MENQNVTREKSRNLSTAEYFVVLQLEYLQAEFRRKIYYSPKDKTYYDKVLAYKKGIIDRISKQYTLKSIFNCDDKLTEIRNKCFRENDGFPLFALNENDLKNYFLIDNEFSYQGEIVKLLSVDLPNLTGIIAIKGEEKNIKLKEIKRVL